MNRNHDPSAKKGSTVRQALGIAMAGAFAAWAVLHSAESGHDSDPGKPEQRDPTTPAPKVSESHKAGAGHKYHPLPWYTSDKGPDGKIDFFAHKHTEHGMTSYRIDGGTPTPASAGPEPAPEQPLPSHEK